MPTTEDRFTITSPEFLADPAAKLAAMRAAGPLVPVKVPLIGQVLLTTTDAGARALLKDRRFVRNPKPVTGKSLQQTFWFMPRFLSVLTEGLIMKDGDDHRRLRHLVELAFGRMTIEDMAGDMAGIADNLLDGLPRDRPVDLVPRYCRPLPLHAISILLGVPAEDRDRIARMIRPITRITPFTFLAAAPGLWRVIRHFRADIALLKETPRPGLLSELVRAETKDGALSEEEVLSFAILLFLAGHETTVHLIADAFFSLLTHPDQADALRSAPEAIPVAIEEFMRFHSPAMMTKMMTAAEDLEFEGVPVAKGTRVSAFLLAANHDPARVEAPDALNLDRLPNAHLGFGFGPHVCLGMQLARVEARVALERFLTRFPQARLADPQKPPSYAPRFGLRAVPSLNVMLG